MRGVLLATAILLVVTTLPYVWCSLQGPVGAEFAGPLAYPDAFNSDLGWTRQVQDGYVFLTNVFDHLPPRHAYFNGFWLPFGVVARISGLSLITLFHVARWSSSLLLVLAFWAGLRRCVGYTIPRRALLAFFMVGGGFGWLVAGVSWLLLGKPILTYELRSVFYPFMEMLLSAHIPASHALMLATAYLWSRGEETRAAGWFVLAGATAALLASFHPYQIPTLWLGLLIYALATALSNRKKLWGAASSRMSQWAWLILIPLPVILYFIWLLYCVEGFASWRLHPPAVPPLWSLPFHLGPLAMLGVWGWKDLREIKRSPLARVCGALFLTNFLIVHSPIAFSWSRQADVPLIGLGMLFVAPAVGAKWQRTRKHGYSVWSKRLLLPLLVLALGDGPLVVAKRTATAQRAFPFQVSVDLLEVFHALDDRSDFTTVVLSDPEMGTLIPRYAGARSLLGHPQVTSRYDEKVASYQRILEEPTDPVVRDDFLRNHNINYWITTPRSDPAAQDLPLVFEAGDFRLRLVSEQ